MQLRFSFLKPSVSVFQNLAQSLTSLLRLFLNIRQNKWQQRVFINATSIKLQETKLLLQAMQQTFIRDSVSKSTQQSSKNDLTPFTAMLLTYTVQSIEKESRVINQPQELMYLISKMIISIYKHRLQTNRIEQVVNLQALWTLQRHVCDCPKKMGDKQYGEIKIESEVLLKSLNIGMDLGRPKWKKIEQECVRCRFRLLQQIVDQQLQHIQAVNERKQQQLQRKKRINLQLNQYIGDQDDAIKMKKRVISQSAENMRAHSKTELMADNIKQKELILQSQIRKLF